MADISWVGVLVGALGLFVLGGLWFGAVFGAAYRRVLGVPESSDGASSTPPAPALGRALAGQFVAGVVIAGALAVLVGNTSAARGAVVGLAGGVLVAGALVQLYQFEGRGPVHLLITTAYFLVGVSGVGAILGAFQGA